MITAPLSTHHNVTPDNLSREQDALLLAGSKVSMREIYKQQIELPMVKGKYYKAEDVDNLFVLINGIFTSVSEQSFRSDKALTEARENVEAAEKEKAEVVSGVGELELRLSTVMAEKQTLEHQYLALESVTNTGELKDTIAELEGLLTKKSADYTRLAESSTVNMQAYQDEVARLDAMIHEKDVELVAVQEERDDYRAQAESLTSEINDIVRTPSVVSDPELESEHKMLQYKYEQLQTLSAQRINDLTKEIDDLKQ